MYCLFCNTSATPTCAKKHPGEFITDKDAIAIGIKDKDAIAIGIPIQTPVESKDPIQTPVESKDPTEYSVTAMNFLVNHANSHEELSPDTNKKLYFLICQILEKFPKDVLYKNRDVENEVSKISQYGHENSVDKCSFLHDAVLEYFIKVIA
jgi:hypothetical protein